MKKRNKTDKYKSMVAMDANGHFRYICNVETCRQPVKVLENADHIANQWVHVDETIVDHEIGFIVPETVEAAKAREEAAARSLRAHELFADRTVKHHHRFFDGHGKEFFVASSVEVDEAHNMEFNDSMLPEIPSELFKIQVNNPVPFQPVFELCGGDWPTIGHSSDNVITLTVDSENVTPEFADALMGKFPQPEKDVTLPCEFPGCEFKVFPGPDGTLEHKLEVGGWVDHTPVVGWIPFGYPSSDATKGETLDWDLPEGETRVTNATTGASKGSKSARFDLIPVPALTELAELYGFGVKKYAARNWEKGYNLSLSYAALQRHANAWWGGEDTDGETSLSHMAAVGWHAFTLMTLLKTHPEMDDRPTTVHDPLDGFDPEHNRIAFDPNPKKENTDG